MSLAPHVKNVVSRPVDSHTQVATVPSVVIGSTQPLRDFVGVHAHDLAPSRAAMQMLFVAYASGLCYGYGMSKRKSPAPLIPVRAPRGRPAKPVGSPRVETTVAMGCTFMERARLKTQALGVRGQSLSNYLRSLAELPPIV